MKPLYFTRDWLVYFLRNGKNHMQLFWDGLDLFIFLCSSSSNRGVRSSQGHFLKCAPVVLINLETQFCN